MMTTNASPTRRREAGFTLVELMLVVTIIGIIAATVLPGLQRARGAAIEVQTIGSLHAIFSSQLSYSTACAGGFFAPSIPWLATLSKPGAAPFIGPEFPTNTTDRQGYRILFSAGSVVARAPQTCNGLAAGQAVDTYFVGADLLQLTNGVVMRYFGVNSSGVIYQSTQRVNVLLSGVPPAPARPIG
jgi:prepilin-type N-terminal cleavage/methylation domain-containing protein